MSKETVLPIWNALRSRFQKKVEGMASEDLNLQLGETTVAGLLYHTAEVEYMFSGWFFDKPLEEEMSRPTDLKGYIQLLHDSNQHFVQAINDLPADAWDQIKQSSFGESTPLEAVGRLMNHTGMHNGQISYIQKYGSQEAK